LSIAQLLEHFLFCKPGRIDVNFWSWNAGEEEEEEEEEEFLIYSLSFINSFCASLTE
jgi:hypothetical protein